MGLGNGPWAQKITKTKIKYDKNIKIKYDKYGIKHNTKKTKFDLIMKT